MADIFGRFLTYNNCADCNASFVDGLPVYICNSCGKPNCPTCSHLIGKQRFKLLGGDHLVDVTTCKSCRDAIIDDHNCPECKHPLTKHDPTAVYDPFYCAEREKIACKHEFMLFTTVEKCLCNGRMAALAIELGY